MDIPGYDGQEGIFPFEVGDVLVREGKGDLVILLGANSAYVHFWFVRGVLSSDETHHVHCLDWRIERVINECKRVGHIDADALALLPRDA
jgi:hypothetical protein